MSLFRFLKSGEMNFVVPENIKGSTEKQQRGYEEHCKKRKKRKEKGIKWVSVLNDLISQ